MKTHKLYLALGIAGSRSSNDSVFLILDSFSGGLCQINVTEKFMDGNRQGMCGDPPPMRVEMWLIPITEELKQCYNRDSISVYVLFMLVHVSS